ncbi:MAG: hypothetical protein JW709_12495 [Sedimentisphaerales bacterium]|nr:hypothetical protein [Sedimentisphaerales bacterium]
MKNPGVMQIEWIPPETLQWVKQNSWNNHYYREYVNPSQMPETKTLPDGTVMEYRYTPVTDIHTDNYLEPLNTIPVLLDSGKIVKLDRQTLALTDSLGWIPLNKDKQNINDSLLAYNIRLFEREGKHHALAVATLDRFARHALIILFDNHGQPVVRQIPKNHPHYSPNNTSDTVFESCNFPNTIDQYPGGPLTVTGQFITESLQVPIIQLGSLYFTETLEPSAVMRTVVWMPDSLLATVILPDNDSNISEVITAISLTLLPGILLCIFLAWRVVRDGKIIGVCRWGRLCWFWGTILFGLPMYITYRLTRPATTLVTCPACGHGRQPDGDTCHRCGAAWNPAELNAPTWRIIEPA